MGFYDDFDAKPRKRSGSWLASVIIAALVGSGSTLLMVPAMIKANVIKLPEASQVVSSNGKLPSQTVAYNVETGIVSAVNRVKPAVVTVVNIQKVGGYFNRGLKQEAGKGSGVIIDNQGHIVTNNHVVDGASDVEIIVNDEHIKAKVLGTDELTDLAVLQVPTDKIKEIKPVELGSSEALQTGEPAIAIGNPLGEFEQTVTVGVISAKKRMMEIYGQNGRVVHEQPVLQTDAAINPGNSGGALINIKGQLIGINSAKIAERGIEGLGFAIPIDEAKPIIEQLMSKGKVIRPALGVGVEWDVKDIPENYKSGLPINYGVVVSNVTPGSPADKAGLKAGDVIFKIDNTQIHTFLDLRKYLFSKKPGDTVQVTFYRENKENTVSVTLMELK
ncbi:S1C family serine protease [Effusibacillus lacus]|uniref:Serine protease n=1 Tax=Effusibacillus lacus TaxID=1348429 RepID=A0A292YKT3_9BACL|nr:trypsin-like peptidase domain-containing protein [Effusibacillus lacus]TCS75145.1 serine protease Do [Effusibacillus lacus]GAX89095.1 serine protease [Effusibacillus lacus]